MAETTRQFKHTWQVIVSNRLAIKLLSSRVAIYDWVLHKYLQYYINYQVTPDHFLTGLDSLGTRHLTFQVLDPTELTWFLETISCHLHTHYIYITFPIFTSNTASLPSICVNVILVALANNEVWSSNLWRHLWFISWALYNSFIALAVTLFFLQLLMALKPLISNPHLALTPENIRPIDRYCMFFSVVICFGFFAIY